MLLLGATGVPIQQRRDLLDREPLEGAKKQQKLEKEEPMLQTLRPLTCSGWAEPILVCRRTSAIPAAPEVCGAVCRSRFKARSGSLVG